MIRVSYDISSALIQLFYDPVHAGFVFRSFLDIVISSIYELLTSIPIKIML